MSARKRVCPTPDKRRYVTRWAAERALRRTAWTDRVLAPTRLYWCRGGHYHVTSRP